MKTKTLLQTIGLTIIIMSLTTLYSNAQIPIKGLASDNEGVASWDADGSGPEPEASGHQHPWGWGSSLYYTASREYVLPSSGAAMCHFEDNITGFPLFVQALTDNGFSPEQVKVKYGLTNQKEDIGGEDWFTFDGKHYYNRYDGNIIIELNGEPMVSAYVNFNFIRNEQGNSHWTTETNFSTPYNISEGSSPEVQAVTEAFLDDMGGEEFRLTTSCTAGEPFGGNGRVNGTYFDVNSGYLEKGSPELPNIGLASDHQGIAGWDADGSGPEPAKQGHSVQWGGNTYQYSYYWASRDYDGIDPNSNAALCHLTEGAIGFPNLLVQLGYRGYSLDQLKVKSNIFTLGNDIEGIDWGLDGSIHWWKSYGSTITIEIADEPILEYVIDSNLSHQDLANLSEDWMSSSVPAVVVNISTGSSEDAQHIAKSFMKDLSGHMLSSYIEGMYANQTFIGNGRDGAFQQINTGKMIAKQPEGLHVWPGDVRGTWSLDKSPYVIMGEINVPDGEMLIIEPGVEIQFNTTEMFMINGCIQAEGTEELPIIFTAFDNDVRWGGIGWDQTLATNEASVLKHCIFEYAYAYNYMNLPGYNSGGAIAVNDYENIEISHCLFRHNLADKPSAPGAPGPTGGAIMLHESSLHISHCIFYNNRAGHGGAITLSAHSNAIIDNCLFYDNEAIDWYGGAIMTNTDCSPSFINCTFADNYALEGGGAVDLEIGGTATFTNCIFWGNKAGAGANQISIWDPDISYLNVYSCDVEEGVNGIEPGFQGDYIENINVDPMFATIGLYQFVPDTLQALTINSGTLSSDYLPENYVFPESCLCGNPRVDGGAIDMGCFEYDEWETGIGELSSNDNFEFNIYPNPINLKPSIEFYLEHCSQVNITVLDIQGKIIFESRTKELPGGKNRMVWDAENITPGVYFCKIKAGNDIATKKVVKLN